MRHDHLPEAMTGLGPALDAAGFVGTWETDLHTKIVRMRGGLGAILGIDATSAGEGVSVERFLQGVHGDDRQRVASLITVAHESRGRFEAEYRVVGLDGRIRWVAARGQVETAEDGRARCLGVVVDVTDTRLRAEQQEDAAETIRRIVTAMVEARSSIERLGAPVLKTLIDILMIELGSELARRDRPAAGSRVH